MGQNKRFFLLIIFLLFSGTLWGQDYSSEYGAVIDAIDIPFLEDQNTGTFAFPLLQIPMGGLYESMGTALTAVAIDSSGIIANPAISAILPSMELSLFHNDWIDDVNIESLVFTGRFDHLGYGAALNYLYVPFREYNDWAERAGGGYYSEVLATLNVSYNFFNSFYFEGFSVGANLKGAYRHIPLELETEGLSALSVMADFGILTRLNLGKFYVSRDKNFAIGASVKNLGVPVFYTHNDEAADSIEPLPSEASVGISYSPFRPLLLSVDFNYPFSLIPDTEAMKWNISAGMNLSVTDFLALQGGFRYDGQNPRFTLGSKIDLDWVNFLVNYTLDLTTQFSTPFDRLSIQAQVDLGDDGRALLQKQVDELYIAGLEAYANGDIPKAIRYWTAAINLDPTFEPALEYLYITQTNVDLLKELEDLTRVE